jgi:opacity protein-like surface antigen
MLTSPPAADRRLLTRSLPLILGSLASCVAAGEARSPHAPGRSAPEAGGREELSAAGPAASARSTPAQEESSTWSTWCLALSGGYTCVDSSSGDVSGNDVDETDTGFGAFVAYRPIRYASIELGYQDLGEETYTDVSTPPFVFEGDVRTTGLQACVVGHYPVWGPIEALARVGVFLYDSEDSGDTIAGGGGSYSEKDDGTEFTYGVGAQVAAWGPLSVRLEYQRIDGIKFDNYWLSLIWGF